MNLTSYDLLEMGIIDKLFGEPKGGLDMNSRSIYQRIKNALKIELELLSKLNRRALIEQRYKKYRRIGDCSPR